MYTLHGTSRDFSDSLKLEVAHYRHSIFIERLGWDLPVEGGKELDQFDHDDTIYVVAKNNDGRVSGCARLLPTTESYLLGEIFPQLMNGMPIPCSRDIWELSRFAAADITSPSNTESRADASRALLAAAVECAMHNGATRLITVSPLGIERLLARMGVNAHRAGPPVKVDGKPIYACWIEIDDKTRSALGIKSSPEMNRILN